MCDNCEYDSTYIHKYGFKLCDDCLLLKNVMINKTVVI